MSSLLAQERASSVSRCRSSLRWAHRVPTLLTVLPRFSLFSLQRRLLPRAVQEERSPDSRSGKEGTRRSPRQVSVPTLSVPVALTQMRRFRLSQLRDRAAGSRYIVQYADACCSSLSTHAPSSRPAMLTCRPCETSAFPPAGKKRSKNVCESARRDLTLGLIVSVYNTMLIGVSLVVDLQQEARQASLGGVCFHLAPRRRHFSLDHRRREQQAKTNRRRQRRRETTDRVRERGTQARVEAAQGRRVVPPSAHEMKPALFCRPKALLSLEKEECFASFASFTDSSRGSSLLRLPLPLLLLLLLLRTPQGEFRPRRQSPPSPT